MRGHHAPTAALATALHTVRTTIDRHLHTTPHEPLDVHQLLAEHPDTAEHAVLAALADSAGLTAHRCRHEPANTLNWDAFTDPTDLSRRLRCALGPNWLDVYELAEAAATMPSSQAHAIIRYARAHKRAQRNALRALDTGPGLRTGPSINAVMVTIDCLERNTNLSPAQNALTGTQFGALCDELAATGRAITVMHLVGRRGSGRLKHGHIDSLTAAYRAATTAACYA